MATLTAVEVTVIHMEVMVIRMEEVMVIHMEVTAIHMVLKFKAICHIIQICKVNKILFHGKS